MPFDPTITMLVLNGGIVVLVGMIVGIPYGIVAVSNSDDVAKENWRIAHVQNLQNGMLLLLVAACASYLLLSPFTLQLLTWALISAAYFDMAAWFLRAATGKTGLKPTLPIANLVICALFSLTVIGQFLGFGIFVVGAFQAMS